MNEPVTKMFMPGRRNCVYVSTKRFISGQKLVALRTKYGYEAEGTMVHRENLHATKADADAAQRRIMQSYYKAMVTT